MTWESLFTNYLGVQFRWCINVVSWWYIPGLVEHSWAMATVPSSQCSQELLCWVLASRRRTLRGSHAATRSPPCGAVPGCRGRCQGQLRYSWGDSWPIAIAMKGRLEGDRMALPAMVSGLEIEATLLDVSWIAAYGDFRKMNQTLGLFEVGGHRSEQVSSQAVLSRCWYVVYTCLHCL